MEGQSTLQAQSPSHTHIHTLMVSPLPNTDANLEPPGPVWGSVFAQGHFNTRTGKAQTEKILRLEVDRSALSPRPPCYIQIILQLQCLAQVLFFRVVYF